MDEKPAFRPFIFPMLFLAIIGWGGLVALMFFTLPTILPRWAFFALTVMAFTGTTLPVAFIVNQRFLSNAASVVTRQSIWVGVYVAILAWLQIGRILNFSVALWFVLGFLGLEYLIQLRQRPARRKRQKEDEDPAE